ncbi:Catabolite control protein A [compost metagenome]
MGKQLRSRKTMTLGVVVLDIGISYHAEIIKGIEQKANAMNYKILICNSQNEKMKELEYLSLLQNRTVDGIILVAPMLSDGEIASFAGEGYAIGVIGRRLGHLNIPCSTTDNWKIGRDVVTHLAANGHRRIAFLNGYEEALDSIERLQGFKEGLAEAGLPFLPNLVERGDFSEDGGYAAFRRLWEESSDFTAVFAANDEMALGVYKACSEYGIAIPDRMAVVGVDNIRITNYVSPKISSVEQPLYELGGLLADKVIDQINGDLQPGQKDFVINSRLIVKGSSQKGADSI